MEHPLDNPIYNALISNNKYLSNGNEQAKHFADDVAPFVGLKDNSDDDFQQLYELLPFNRPGVFIKHVDNANIWDGNINSYSNYFYNSDCNSRMDFGKYSQIN